ncbi:transcriptional regulatory protein WalR [Abditibacteriota bacterium]|nr:transcriptional regulatory protein WalR [Abditibacteriota bacterium]
MLKRGQSAIHMRLPDVPSDNRFRILVAEDDPSIAKLVTIHLKMAGFEAFVARDGLEAWSQFPQVDPHLILTDINMPGLSGHELVEKVRGASSIPILMMTAADTDEAQMQGFKVGADDYIPKPFNPKLLTARVIANLRRVYRYSSAGSSSSTNQTEANNAAAPSMGLPEGFARCESCGYLGPVWKFDTRDTLGNKAALCPNCHSKNITFALA